ncbi:MAG: hypothetical protein CMB43_00685 [Euryarchaeota archaeon]|nr:hypothetical protein [Euryarchaeota archaeon]|tara:strand:- start:44 stop:1123 length:1080 start_codon:yes stop_codon:yes gene_type:complete
MADVNLNELATALDTEDMIGFTRAFVDNFTTGLRAVNPERYPWIEDLAKTQWHGVIALGMGGSAAGGDFLSVLCNQAGSIPVIVQRDYVLPAWWNERWLILSTSHSGNTEEAIAATEIALKSGATVVVISTGGILSGLAELHYNCHFIPSIGGQPPRSAFGHIFSRQLALFRSIGILPNSDKDKEMLTRLQLVVKDYDFINSDDPELIELITYMATQPISLLGPTELTPALNRFKNQLNENAARFARIGIFPEMNHNESVAWGGVGDDADFSVGETVILFLTWNGMHSRVANRLEWMIAHTPSDMAWRIHGEGETLLEALLHLCIIMDWLSIAMGLIHGKDPSAIDSINSLKKFLDNKN